MERIAEILNTSASIAQGMGRIPDNLAILFVALKLTGYIEWSWLWVLSPLWLPPALILLIIIPLVGLFKRVHCYIKHKYWYW